MQPVTLPVSENKRVPREPATFNHYMPLQIRFNDIDMVGHVNNSVYLTFFDMGKTRYFMDVWPEPLDWSGISLVIVNVNCDFLEPTYFTDKAHVYTRTVAISEHTVKIEQRIVDDVTGHTKAQCMTILAGFDPKTVSGTPIDPRWIDALEKYENRPLKN